MRVLRIVNACKQMISENHSREYDKKHGPMWPRHLYDIRHATKGPCKLWKTTI